MSELEKAPIQKQVFDFIKKNSGMSASISVVANGICEDYRWTNHSKFSVAIRRLKEKGLIVEYKGRYYYYEDMPDE